MVLFVPAAFFSARPSRVESVLQAYKEAIDSSIEYCVLAEVDEDSDLVSIAQCIQAQIPYNSSHDVMSLFVGLFLSGLSGDALQDGGVVVVPVQHMNLWVYVLPPRELV